MQLEQVRLHWVYHLQWELVIMRALQCCNELPWSKKCPHLRSFHESSRHCLASDNCRKQTWSDVNLSLLSPFPLAYHQETGLLVVYRVNTWVSAYCSNFLHILAAQYLHRNEIYSGRRSVGECGVLQCLTPGAIGRRPAGKVHGGNPELKFNRERSPCRDNDVEKGKVSPGM